MGKIKFVLVIDDDQINNFICSRIIRISGITDKVECVLSAQAGLNMLESLNATTPENLPDIIFLDINMPGMNGWEFMARYGELKKQLKKNILIFMLSSSLYKEDIDRSKTYEDIREYIIKPITPEVLKGLETKYFH